MIVGIISVSSDSFNSDIAKVGSKLGYADRFLKEMMKQKMGKDFDKIFK